MTAQDQATPDPLILNPATRLRFWYLHRVVGTLLGAAGVEAATWAASRLARAVHDLDPRTRERMRTHLLEACPELPPEAGDVTTAAVFESTARFWIECLFLRRLLSPGGWNRVVALKPADAWRRIFESPGPVIFVTAHVGNPAVGACVLSQARDRPLRVVADPAAASLIGRFSQLTRRFPRLCIVARAEAARALPRCLDQGDSILLLADAPSPRAGGIEAEFLGRRRRRPAALVRLAHRHRASIAVVACQRRGPMPFAFDLELLAHLPAEAGPETAGDRPPVAGCRRRTAADTMQIVLDTLGQAILDRPGEYLWTRR